MPRENNSQEEKRSIDQQNKKNKKRYENIKKNINESFNLKMSDEDFEKLNVKTIQKTLLYFQQDGYDAYGGIEYKYCAYNNKKRNQMAINVFNTKYLKLISIL